LRHLSTALLLLSLSTTSTSLALAQGDRSPADARVSVDVPDCVPADRALFLKILGIELGVELLGPREKQATLVTMSCEGDAVTVDVVNPATARSTGRAVDLSGESASSGARLLALATAELVESSRLEFTPDGKPIRGGKGVYDTADPQAGGVFVGLGAAGQLGAPDARGELGAALRVEGEVTRRWRWAAGLGATFAGASTALGDVSTGLFTGRVGFARAWVGESTALRAGVDLRVGAWRAAGEPIQGASGRTVWLPVVDVVGGVRFSVVALGPLRVDLGAQVGYPLTGPFVTLDGARALGLDGPWGLVDLGLQLRFGPS
jgi:hypothetical protein